MPPLFEGAREWLPPANRCNDSVMPMAAKRAQQQSSPPNWFSHHVFGPQRGRPMSLQIKFPLQIINITPATLEGDRGEVNYWHGGV